MGSLEKRARELGIEVEYEGVGGSRHRVPRATLERLVAAFGDGPAMTPQRLQAPAGVRCHLPDGPRLWGVAVQLYQLRTSRNWGIGDFADLEALAGVLAQAGADFIGLNPLHAMFLSDPDRCSPFSPSNRRFLNPLYLAVDRVPGFDPGMVDTAAISRLRAGVLVDYAAVAAEKLRVLRAAWQAAGEPDASVTFRARGGADLDRHALFEAISARMVAAGHGAGWRAWPVAWQDAGGAEATGFARDHASELAFYCWLQDQADSQLSLAREACKAAGMAIGLYLDIAVGEATDGSGSWGLPDVLSGFRIGAPPDYFNEKGQDWGLAPLSPAAMVASRAAPFGRLIEAVMHSAGAVRIDHAMGLWQLFLIPEGAEPAAGAYVRYPLDDMLRALAAAANRHGALVIGEDLGNVPPGFREMMKTAGILSYRILFFERDEDRFIAPQDYPRDALACLSTHDLPTFQGWWRGDDVRLRVRFDLVSQETGREQAKARPGERRDLVRALVAEGLLPADGDVVADAAPLEITVAVHRYLARTASRLMVVRLEDIAEETVPVNLPSTEAEYPNWRPKLRASLDEVVQSPAFLAITQAIAAERPGRRRPGR